MDFGKAFSYPFEDREWGSKILVASLIQLIPLIGSLIVTGWGFEITRRVIRKEPTPLADWNQLGDYLVRGLQICVIGLVYALPIILFSTCTSLLFITPYSSGSSDTLSAVATIATIVISIFSIIYGILIAFLIPIALGHFAATNQFAAAFQFKEIFQLLKSAPAAYLLVLLGNFISGFIAGLGAIACMIGVLATSAYATSINAHLSGQAYLEASTSRSY